MVTQLEKYTSDIIVVDNNSKFKPLLDYYENDFKYTLLRQKENFGHKVYKKDFVQNIVGDVYILTDPDLQFNAKLPNGFIQTLIDISNYFKIERVGFALSCDGDDFRTDLRFFGRTVKEFENGYWIERYHYPLDGNLQLYTAPIDTTFCLINKNFSGKCIRMFDYPYFIRVAGDYTCLHLPWYKNFQSKLMEGELEAYTQGNISSTWLI